VCNVTPAQREIGRAIGLLDSWAPGAYAFTNFNHGPPSGAAVGAWRRLNLLSIECPRERPTYVRRSLGATFTEPAVAVRADDAPLSAWPIPNEDVVAGDPSAAAAIVSRSPDSRLLRGIWHCTPGSFRAVYSWDETIVGLRGRATVHLESGQSLELSEGVVAFVGRGQGATWTVHEPFVKAFHIDSPDPISV
jgi:uncharacterized cupin superfamily protein